MSTTAPEMSHEAEHAFTRRGIAELVQQTYGNPPVRIDILLDGTRKPCPCNDEHVRLGGVRLKYDQGELVWRFAYCCKCGVAWYVVPISREEEERVHLACQATFGGRLGAMVAASVIQHAKGKLIACMSVRNDRTGEMRAVGTAYEGDN